MPSFPFPDSIEAASRAGVVAIVQPGGSRRDDEVIAACNLHRIPMVFTGASTSSISTILEKIVATKKNEVAAAYQRLPLAELSSRLCKRLRRAISWLR